MGRRAPLGHSPVQAKYYIDSYCCFIVGTILVTNEYPVSHMTSSTLNIITQLISEQYMVELH